MKKINIKILNEEKVWKHNKFIILYSFAKMCKYDIFTHTHTLFENN